MESPAPTAPGREFDFVHAGPGTLAGHYLRMYWQPVHCAADLPRGEARPIHVLGEAFTLYRGESGAAHLVAFRCAHRGTQLSTGWVEGDNLRCHYHGWTYDASGRCIEQPEERDPFCEKVRIRSYPTYEYLGLIFAYLGEGDPPPVPRFALFEQPGDLWARVYVQPCNYFNHVENTADPGHTKFVHRRPLHREYGLTGIPTVTAEEHEWGLSTHITWPGWPPDEVDTHHVLMPNGMMNRIAHGDLLSWRVPIDDASHLGFSVALARRRDRLPRAQRGRTSVAGPDGRPFSVREWSERVLAGEARVDRLLQEFQLSSTDAFNLQDYVSQVGQGVVADRVNERLGGADVGIVLLRKVWHRELAALAAGQPITRWAAERVGLEEWGAEPSQPSQAGTAHAGGWYRVAEKVEPRLA